MDGPAGQGHNYSEPPANNPYRRVWIILGSVCAVAITVLILVWLLKHPMKDTLWYEVAKTALQVLGVAVVGGIITVATSTYQHERQAADKDLETRRRADADEAENVRQEFNLRTALLDRSSKCAQKMFVTCQDVRRKQADYFGKKDPISTAKWEEARSLLDRSYLDFNAEAEAIETELGARYGIPEDQKVDSVYVLWHQVSDLLTLYYFNLCRNFRKDILDRNAKSESKRHSGLGLEKLKVANPQNPTLDELRDMRHEIRPCFNEAMPKFASAVLNDDLIQLDKKRGSLT
jgi:hypothetical protein